MTARRVAPRQVLVEPTGRHARIEMRIKDDGRERPFLPGRHELRIGQQQVIVNERPVPVVAARGTADVLHRGADQRDRPGGEQGVCLVRGIDRNTQQAKGVEWLCEEGFSAALKRHTFEVRREPAPCHCVCDQRSSEREPGVRLLERTAGPSRNDGEGHAVPDAEIAITQYGRAYAAANLAHVLRRRFRRITLLVHVGMLKPGERRQRLRLRQRRHSPRADRRADQLDCGGAGQPRMKHAVEWQQREALRSTRRRRYAGDVAGQNPMLLDMSDRGRPTAQDER